MADNIADGKQSRQKVTLTGHTLGKRGKGDYIELTYTKEDGSTQKTGAFIAALDEDSKTRIKAGGEVCIVKTKSGDFWNLTKVDDVSTYVAKAPYTPRSGGGGSGGGSYDQTGIKVGAARNQAIAFLAATKGSSFTLDDVDSTAYEIVTRQAKQEDTVRAGSTNTSTATSTKTVETTTTLQNGNVPVGNLEEIKF